MKDNEAFIPHFENEERIGYLVSSYIKGTLTMQERRELDNWLLESEDNEILFDELTREENVQKTMQWYASIDRKKAWRMLEKRIAFRKQPGSFAVISIAATVVILVGVAIFFIIRKAGPAGKIVQPIAVLNDVAPGTNKAVLTLGDGTTVILDSTAPTVVAGAKVKVEQGAIIYDGKDDTPPKENLLTVPRAAQFRVTLSDGTSVWLNSKSSLRYPTSFTGNDRRVVLTGEGYFEVAKNKEKPFIVESDAGTVKVLGTHFDINTYGDEDHFTTTLLEGSVEISKGANSKLLSPGQQASVTETGISVTTADTTEAIAWKNGEFVFRNAAVSSIVKQLARWYDVDVEFLAPVDKHLNATIQRNVPLSKVLHYLEETGEVHFKTEGRKLIVSK